MISVIVPAYNEEAVIGRTLRGLVEGARAGELELIVVANGCTDRTAQAARSIPGPIKVIETPVGSKTNAINLGEQSATGFPRFYVDADVQITLDAIRLMASELTRTGALAVGPGVRVDLTRASWPVRAFYRIDDLLWSKTDGIGHTGVYGLSEAGRKRFSQFPPVIGDDAFVKRHFAESERIGVPQAVSIVTPPSRLSGLVRIKTRSHLGNYELTRRYPDLKSTHKPASKLPTHARDPRLWPHLAVYVLVKLVARARAKRQLSRGSKLAWERDDTSRH